MSVVQNLSIIIESFLICSATTVFYKREFCHVHVPTLGLYLSLLLLMGGSIDVFGFLLVLILIHDKGSDVISVHHDLFKKSFAIRLLTAFLFTYMWKNYDDILVQGILIVSGTVQFLRTPKSLFTWLYHARVLLGPVYVLNYLLYEWGLKRLVLSHSAMDASFDILLLFQIITRSLGTVFCVAAGVVLRPDNSYISQKVGVVISPKSRRYLHRICMITSFVLLLISIVLLQCHLDIWTGEMKLN